MQKFLLTLCFSLSILIGPTRQANAAVISAGTGTTAAVAQVFLGLSALSVVVGCSADVLRTGKMCLSDANVKSDLEAAANIFLILISLVVLDGEDQYKLKEVTLAQAHDIGLTEDELESFNSNLDELNIVLTNATEELLDREEIGSDEEATEVVISHGADVDSQAFNAFMKIRAYNAQFAQSLMSR